MDIPAGLFKAQCLKLMDRVAEKHETITVTKRGKPVARLVPVDPAPERPLFGYLRGKGKITGDIVAPTGEAWEAQR
jgi:prevent-host-death family protein